MRATAPRQISLALQGGGAHGAFTWGVLDRLLDAPEFEVAAISATSAGAMNAAAFKSGLLANGRPGAKAALADFWHKMAGTGGPVPEFARAWIAALAPPLPVLSAMAEANPAYLAGSVLAQAVSPYDTNPTNFHPLRGIVDQFDFNAIGADHGPSLHIAATNVRSGKIRVFTGAEISTDAILASACLPTLYRAIEIPGPDGTSEAYWDGGYMGNPALFPLYTAPSQDILIVHINPITRPDIPKTAADIQNRINEISFNATLLRELRAIEFVQRLLDQNAVPETEKRRLRIHSVADDATMTQIGVATKLSPNPALISRLHDAGYAAMDRFLHAHGDRIGIEGSCDLREMFA